MRACLLLLFFSTSLLAAEFTLQSPAFMDGETMPLKYTCDGDDISPPLVWSNLNPKAKTLALIMDDPDAPAGTWVHWVLWNIPRKAGNLLEKMSLGMRGTNSFQKKSYGGPCPPAGKIHHYYFKLYALEVTLSLKDGATKEDLAEAMKDHILGEAQLMTTYERK